MYVFFQHSLFCSHIYQRVYILPHSLNSRLKFSGLLGGKYVVPGLSAMKMALWLCIYNEYFAQKVETNTFYDHQSTNFVLSKKVTSQIIMEVISPILSGVVEDQIVTLFGFFVCPGTLFDTNNPLLSLFYFPGNTCIQGWCICVSVISIHNFMIISSPLYVYVQLLTLGEHTQRGLQ